jgi:hypothetical protein
MASAVVQVQSPISAPRKRVAERDRTGSKPRLVDGRYAIQRILGQGAAAVVYEVVDNHTGRRLALKQLLPCPTDARRVRLSFRREFHTLATMRHPNIVQVHDFGVDQKRLYFTMELLGEPRLAARLPAYQVCRLLRDVASALAFLHARRLIHGDVSRRNIGVDTQGTMKLLDFGLLVTVGVPGSGRGTLPYMAPEVDRGLPIDHRVDLFSLGALAYRLLTGSYAYPTTSEATLDEAWSRRPAPPAKLDPSIPRELSDLVLSMVSVDPLGRPDGAAEVIDRVHAIARLPRAPEGEVERGYLASSAMVGRAVEMRALRQAVANARRGQGSSVMIQGCSGMGKTRILEELEVEAQLAGVRVLSARCSVEERAPYSVLHDLLRPLLRAEARAGAERPGTPSAKNSDGTLSGLIRWAGGRTHRQDRLAVQQTLIIRLLAEADTCPLVILVDDLQRSDEPSAAVLAAVAHQAPSHRIVLITSLRTDEEWVAPAAVKALAGHSQRMRIRGLEVEEVQELMERTFGQVDNVRRLAQRIHASSDGSPLCCSELARLLVERGTVTYEDGMWRIPQTIASLELPRALMGVMERRVSSLTPDARNLAEALSVHGGTLDLEICVELARGEAEAFALLDELVEKEILVGTRRRLRFRHDGLREALLRRLDSQRRRDLHLRVGRLLERNQGREASDEEVGWHLLEGGEQRRAADLLERAGRRHLDAQAFAEAAPCLEAALEVLENEGAPRRRRLELKAALVRAGVITNRQLALRHGDDLVDALAEDSGTNLAVRLGPILGRRLGFLVAMFLTVLRWLFASSRRKGLFPVKALVQFITMVNYVIVIKSLSFDVEGARAALRRMAPVASLSRAGRAAYLFGASFEPMVTGRLQTARMNLERYLKTFDRVWRPPVLLFDDNLGRGAAQFTVSLIAALQLDPRCLEEFKRLESADLQFFGVSAKLGRLLYHRARGEESKAQALEVEVKLLLVQMGSVWLWESLLCWVSALSYCGARDLTALKRSVAELEGWVAQGLRLEPVVELCRGVYQYERGEVEAARRTFEELVAMPACRENLVFSLSASNAYAHVLNALGRPHEAHAATFHRDPEATIKPVEILAEANLAISRAMLGEVKRADRHLEELFSVARDSPIICGTLHEQRTLVALAMGEMDRVRHHLGETEYWFRITENPALVARYEKLAAKVGEHIRARNAFEARTRTPVSVPVNRTTV